MKDQTIFDQFAKKGKGQKLRTDGKAVIYTRVSTKEQAENNASLETQLKYCKELANKILEDQTLVKVDKMARNLMKKGNSLSTTSKLESIKWLP